MIFGTFDFLHVGHMYFLRHARTHGDYLIVVVARDETAAALKEHAPIQTETERAQVLEHIDFIDEVVLGDRVIGSYTILKQKEPDIIAIGYDQKTLAESLKAKIAEFKLPTKLVKIKPYQRRYSSKIFLEQLGL